MIEQQISGTVATGPHNRLGRFPLISCKQADWRGSSLRCRQWHLAKQLHRCCDDRYRPKIEIRVTL